MLSTSISKAIISIKDSMLEIKRVRTGRIPTAILSDQAGDIENETGLFSTEVILFDDKTLRSSVNYQARAGS